MSGVVSIDDVRRVLRDHWLTGIVCDHEEGTDAAACFCCKWRSPAEKSPVGAAHAWIEHVLLHLGGDDTPATRPKLPFSRIDGEGLPYKLNITDPESKAFVGRITVLLDGEEVKHCVAFDRDAGTVVVQARDARDRPLLTEDRSAVAHETICGNVEVRWT